MIIPLFKPSMDEEEVNVVRKVTQIDWIGLGPKQENLRILLLNI